LYQGGAEVSFEVAGFSRDMVVMLQGFIVLFSGAMATVFAPGIASAFRWCGARLRRSPDAAVAAAEAPHG
jgi:simple sugar transport system permease protein